MRSTKAARLPGLNEAFEELIIFRPLKKMEK
jgi:hypothetical protein